MVNLVCLLVGILFGWAVVSPVVACLRRKARRVYGRNPPEPRERRPEPNEEPPEEMTWTEHHQAEPDSDIDGRIRLVLRLPESARRAYRLQTEGAKGAKGPC